MDYFGALKAAASKPEKVRQHPLHIQLEPTTFCNLECKMCIRNDVLEKERHLSFDDFLKIFHSIKPKKITFAGAGEPTLNPMLADMIRYAADHGVSAMISSNLTTSFSVLKKIALSGLKVMKISIDAANKETYKAIRGSDFFDRIIESVKAINKLREEGKKPIPELRFDFVILKENAGELRDVINLAGELKIGIVYFRVLQSTGLDDDRYKSLTCNFDIEVLKNNINQARKLSYKKGLRTNLEELQKDFLHLEGIYSSRNGNYNNKICLLPWLQAFISVEGDISPCCALYTNMKMSMGNVLKEAFDDVWNGEKYRKLRRDFKKGVKYSICRDCMPRGWNEIFSMAKLVPSFIK